MRHPDIRATERSIGQRLKQVRRMHGFSQQRLAEALGVTFQQIQKYEKGSNRISAGMLLHIAKLFGLSPATLFGELESQNKQSNLPLINAYNRLWHPLLQEAALLQVRCLADFNERMQKP